MKILFYVEPWIEKALPAWRDNWIYYVLAPFHNVIRQFKNADCAFIVGDAQTANAAANFKVDPDKIGVITQQELRAIFPDFMAATLAWYRDTATPAQMNQMTALVASKLRGFEPDIIIAHFTPVPYLKKLFPRALVLHEDYSVFSRPSFPVSFSFDPAGISGACYLAKYHAEIEQKPLSDREKKFLSLFRQKYCGLMARCTPFTRDTFTGGKNFKHLVLLPLQVSQTFSFEGNCAFHDQWDMLCHALDHIRPDIGVVVTEHSDWNRLLTPKALTYLRATYPNFIYVDETADYQWISQFIIQHVDAVAAVSTSLAYQALLWKKPVCALGHCHINLIADVENIADLGAFLDTGRYQDKDALLAFILTRYNIPVDAPYLKNPAWFEKHLSKMLERFRAGGEGAVFTEPLDDLFRLLKFFIRNADAKAPYRATGSIKN